MAALVQGLGGRPRLDAVALRRFKDRWKIGGFELAGFFEHGKEDTAPACRFVFPALKLGRQLRKRPKKFRDERRLFAHRQFEERRSRFFQNRLWERGKPTEEVRGRHDAGVAQDPAMLMANGFLRPLRGNLKPAKAFADDSESGMKAFPLRDIAALLVGGLHHLSGRAEHSANFQEASLCDMQRSYLVGFGRKRSDGKKSGWRVAKFFNDKITQRSRNA